MLDARESEVPEAERDQEFTGKPVSSRIAIVAAGPISNFILATFALWLMFMTCISVMIPTVGEVVPESPAAMRALWQEKRSLLSRVCLPKGGKMLIWHSFVMPVNLEH